MIQNSRSRALKEMVWEHAVPVIGAEGVIQSNQRGCSALIGPSVSAAE